MKRILCSAALLSLAAGPVFAQARAVPQSEYRALIRDCRNFLGRREITEAEAKRLAAQLRKINGVTLPSGQVVPVDTKGEADALDAVSGTTPDKQLRSRFDALADQITTESQVRSGTDPQQLAKRILSAREFASSQPEKEEGDWDFSFLPKWAKPIGKFFEPAAKWCSKMLSRMGKWLGKSLENMFRAIGKFFRWLFRKFPQNKFKFNPKNPFASLGNGVLFVLCFLATVAAVVGVYLLGRNMYEAYEIRTGRKKRGGAMGGDLDLSEEGITDPLGTAQERAAQGDYRAAIRLTYIAALWRLGESGALKLEKNRTNWEYQRALRKKSQALHDELLPATRLFDRVWYGKQTGTQAEFDKVSAIYQKLPAEYADPEAAEPAATGSTATPTKGSNA